ncbi:DUF742 domain-containing protein [Streptomyces bauhiniae]|uniref:DUF742 domain-containing protein n=1 Tax=Streptomyces bauhiniae TaxID=2340725 RepID=UPI0035DA5FFB
MSTTPARRCSATSGAVRAPVVELAADADLPLTVVRVLLGDLAEQGLIRIDAPRRLPAHDGAADPELLREIVRRLREL